MKPLPNPMPCHGHTLTLIDRTPTAGLWSTSRPGESTPGWIVARIRIQLPDVVKMPNGKLVTYEHKEYLPAESEFGKSAWFFRDETIARNRFQAMQGMPKTASEGVKHTLTGGGPLDEEVNG